MTYDHQAIFSILADCTACALYAELNTTPKPGLVDKRNNGSHSDMDYDTFCRSIDTITPFYELICAVSFNCDNLSAVASRIRLVGINAERAMYKATKGVNTHKGAIFNLGLFLSAICSCGLNTQVTLHDVLMRVGGIAKHIYDSKITDGSALDTFSYQNQIDGAMEMAMSGFLNILPPSLAVLEHCLEYAPSANYARVQTLMYIMSKLNDTNVIRRGGRKGLEFVQNRASRIFDNFSIEKVEEFDAQLIERNISCGGSADMLALVLLTRQLLGEFVMS